MNNLRNVIWGIILIALGIILGINTLGIADINIFFDGWWTLFIIIPSILGLLKPNSSKTGNLIALTIGVLLLLSCQNLIDFDMVWSLLIPIILVFMGFSIIFKNSALAQVKSRIKDKKNANKEAPEYCGCFSNQKLDFTDEKFKGCNLSAVFGGVNCNLKGSKLEKETVIEASAIFGGVDIIVPENTNVKVYSTSIFGGVDSKIRNNKENENTIYVNATCLFGGVEIR